MKKLRVLLLLLAFTQPLNALDFTKDLPSPLKSIDDMNSYTKSLEEQEKDTKLDFTQLTMSENVVPNKTLMEARSFLTMQEIRIEYYVQKIEYQITAFMIIQNMENDIFIPGKSQWKKTTVLGDLTLGLRYFLGRYFFVGVGFGVGVFVSIRDEALDELIFDRIFIFQEMGLNLRETSRSVFTISVNVKEGLQLKGIPALIGARNRLINSTTGFIWRYLF